jgi:hypothetical protein
MFQKLLIDGIIQQTTVLIAQLSTSSGNRAPLAHIADQVFFKLAQEIESQGITKAVVADMFGMALRSYQKKTRRLQQGATDTNRTLWEAIYSFIRQGPQTRTRVLARFESDGEREVAAVLTDLVSSGLVFASGAGSRLSYGVTTEQVRQFIQRSNDAEALANVIWMCLFHDGPATTAELLALLRAEPELVDAAIEELCKSGRIEKQDMRWVAHNVVIGLQDNGKEAAMLDHFRAVSKVLAQRAQDRPPDPTLGGATFVFSVFAGHPFEARVAALFSEHRKAVADLWQQVSDYNRGINLQREDADRVTFYLGQSLQPRDPDVPAEQPTAVYANTSSDDETK